MFKSIFSYSIRTYAIECGLKEVLVKKIPKESIRIKNFQRKYGYTIVGEVLVDTVYNGLHEIPGILWEISEIDPEHGLKFRGLTVKEIHENLPRIDAEPMPEAMFWLMLTGEIPTKAQAHALSADWASRGKLPDFVQEMLNYFPQTLNPMSQFSSAIAALSNESKFTKAIRSGVRKNRYWESTYEDCMDLLGKITVIGAIIYRNLYGNREREFCVENTLDWSSNYAKMLGHEEWEFAEFLRLFLTLHSAHDGGNVCAHLTHLVGSVLSDPYSSFASGINGLSGILRSNNAVIVQQFFIELKTNVGLNANEESLEEFCRNYLKSGKILPGFGHSSPCKNDQRYFYLQNFAQTHYPNNELFAVINRLERVVPPLLRRTLKTRYPWPNTVLYSSTLCYNYGFREIDYFVIFFSISRSLGILAQLIWSRALEFPHIRPRSYSTQHLMNFIKKQKTFAQTTDEAKSKVRGPKPAHMDHGGHKGRSSGYSDHSKEK